LANGFEMRFDVIRPELIDRTSNREVLFIQIFRRENFLGRTVFNEERATFH
jgi:hypothetical protein